MPATTLELTDRKLLNTLQSAFPLADRPFESIGEKLGISESEVIGRIADLKAKNVVRQISAIFDSRRLGYRSSLVAMRFDEGDLDRGAKTVNRHPGVSHNYGREGHFNLWFTIAVPPDESLEDTVASIARDSNALSWRMLPTIRFFKIGVNFDMVNEKSSATTYFVPDAPQPTESAGPSENGLAGDWNEAQHLSDRDIAVIRELQEDLELVPSPFDSMAERLGMTVRELFDYADDLADRKLMRRFSAVLHHRRAGFNANAMVVWKVPPERSQEVGEIMARSPQVTHCYERPTYDDWQYSHYTMIHATTRQECDRIAEEIAEAAGITDHELVFSTREYKKTRVRYFA